MRAPADDSTLPPRGDRGAAAIGSPGSAERLVADHRAADWEGTMATRFPRYVSITTWFILMAVTWALAVPGHLSVSNWFWLTLGGVGLALIIIKVLERIKPTQTVAQLLYEVEHPPKA